MKTGWRHLEAARSGRGAPGKPWVWRTFLAMATWLVAASAMAQGSQQPITMVVGFSPGGGVDTVARMIAQELAPVLKRTILVENRPGAGGTIAADSVARAAPDGSTLLFAESSLLIAPHVFPKVSYDVARNFKPIGMVAQAGLAVAVAGNSPFRTLQELLDEARAKPGSLSYASAGVGSQHHLSGEWLKNAAGVNMVHVPYRGGTQAVQDLASGQIPVAIASVAAAAPHVPSGRIRILAVLTDKRFASLPDVPTVSETLPGLVSTPSMFLVAPAGTPDAIIRPISQALPDILRKPEIVKALEIQGSEPRYMDGAELGRWMRDEEQRWVDVIRAANLKFD